MSFVDDAAPDAAAILAEQGETLSYTPYGSTARDVNAVWDPTAGEPRSENDGRIQFSRGTVQVLPTDAPAPDTRDLFTINGTVYAVKTFATSRWIVVFHVEAMRQDRFGGRDSHVQR